MATSTAKLTDKVVRSLTTLKDFEEFWYPEMHSAAFGVRVSGRTRARVFVLRYYAGPHRRRVTLGPYPDLSLAAAREKARKVLARVRLGEDPALEKRERAAAETFGDVADLFLLRRTDGLAKSTTLEYRRIIKSELLPRWRNTKAADIRPAHVIDLLDAIRIDRGSPVMANRTRSLVGAIFAFAEEREIVDGNPARRVRRPAEEMPRERVLAAAEIRKLWNVLAESAEPVASVFRLLLLLGQRSGETKQMEWSDIDDAALWTIPSERTKNSREQRVPLSPQAVTVIDRLRPLTGASTCVFASPSPDKAGSVRWLGKAAARTRTRCGFDFRPHDLRRTFATGVSTLGYDRDLVRWLLNHVDLTITGVYTRHTREPEQRAALAAWGAHVEAIVTAPPAGKRKRAPFLLPIIIRNTNSKAPPRRSGGPGRR